MESKTKVPTSGFLEESHLLLSIFKWPSSSQATGETHQRFQFVDAKVNTAFLASTSHRS